MQSRKQAILRRERRTGLRDIAARRAFNRALIGGAAEECSPSVARKINRRFNKPEQYAFRKVHCRTEKCHYDENFNACLHKPLEELEQTLADINAKLAANEEEMNKLNKQRKIEMDAKEYIVFEKRFETDMSSTFKMSDYDARAKLKEMLKEYEKLLAETSNGSMKHHVPFAIKEITNQIERLKRIERHEIELYEALNDTLEEKRMKEECIKAGIGIEGKVGLICKTKGVEAAKRHQLEQQ